MFHLEMSDFFLIFAVVKLIVKLKIIGVMTDLEKLNKMSTDYLICYKDMGGTSEFNMSINDISRAKIKAFAKEYKEVYLYKINKWKPEDPACVKYEGQKIHNFEFCFALAEKNQRIIDIIEERNTKDDKPYCSKTNMDQVNEIYDIVDTKPHILLIWS